MAKERQRIRIPYEPANGNHVAKAGGEPNFNIKVGYLRDIVDGNFFRPRILVASAPGRDPNDPQSEKVTTHTIRAASYRAEGDTVAMDREFEIVSKVMLSNLDRANPTEEGRALVEQWIDWFYGRLATKAPTEGMPEMVQGLILEQYIPNSKLLEPDNFIFQNQYGMVDQVETKRRTRAALKDMEEGVVYIVPPHNALTARGHVLELTLGSGDEVAGHMSRAAELPLFIFKNTHGIRSADPSLVDGTIFIDRLMLSELHAATLGGAYVVQAGTLRALEETESGYLEVRDYRDSHRRGTIVTRGRDGYDEQLAVLIAGKEGDEAIRLIGRGGTSAQQLEEKIKSVFATRRLPYNHIVAGPAGATILVDEGAFPMMKETKLKALGVDQLKFEEGQGLITMVGRGMFKNSGEAWRRMGAVFDNGISPHGFHESGNGCAFSTLVHKKQYREALSRFHEELVLKGKDGKPRDVFVAP